MIRCCNQHSRSPLIANTEINVLATYAMRRRRRYINCQLMIERKKRNGHTVIVEENSLGFMRVYIRNNGIGN